MNRIHFTMGVLLLSGCANVIQSPDRATSERAQSASRQSERRLTPAILNAEASKEIAFYDENGLLTVEGHLVGSWLRQQSGQVLGDFSKATIHDPLRLRVGSQSVPLVGVTEELEHKLLNNSGKRVRLRGHSASPTDSGRGMQSGQCGYSGPIPAHIVEFMNVSACEVLKPILEQPHSNR